MFHRFLPGLACLLLLVAPVALATAANTVYQITTSWVEPAEDLNGDGNLQGPWNTTFRANDSCGDCDVAVVGGTITTDGTLGTLSTANIVSIDPIMVKSLSGREVDGGEAAKAEVQVSLNASYAIDNGLNATTTSLYLGTNGALKGWGEGPNNTRDLIEWINQEGSGDPGRRIQLKRDGRFGQHRRANTFGDLVVATRVPEPGTVVLLMLGLGAIGAIRRRSN